MNVKKIISIILLISTFLLTFAGCNKDNVDVPVNQSASEEQQTETNSSNETVSKEELENNMEEDKKEEPSTSENTNSSSKPSSSTTVVEPIENELFPGYKYNTELDLENNVFLDALEYTGYNLKKHRADGLMWKYILSNDKKHRNWLSNITFGGGSTGLETQNGLPNIQKFEKGGLVCASFATYVYFNYLPNVAKIDTSTLAIPEKTYSAESFHEACNKWLEKGYTYNIGFTAQNTPSGISFNADKEIPLGSIIVFRDIDKPSKTKADHITVYVGKKNGYHWVIQTGNKNGPEFCAVERFKFGPDPQWPLAIYATPPCIYDAISNPDKK